jgi:dUTP pyrophosphatase
MSAPVLRIARLASGVGLPLPAFQTSGAAGMDLCAAEEVMLDPGGRAAVATGLQVAVPDGFELQVRARSGWALRDGIAVLNAPGTIDSDYRGEVKVILANLGASPVAITRGMRIAQLVLAPVVQPTIVEVEMLDATARGAGGFGSTGRE